MLFSLDMDLDVDMAEDAYEFGSYCLYSSKLKRNHSAMVEPCIPNLEIMGSSSRLLYIFSSPTEINNIIGKFRFQ